MLKNQSINLVLRVSPNIILIGIKTCISLLKPNTNAMCGLIKPVFLNEKKIETVQHALHVYMYNRVGHSRLKLEK